MGDAPAVPLSAVARQKRLDGVGGDLGRSPGGLDLVPLDQTQQQRGVLDHTLQLAGGAGRLLDAQRALIGQVPDERHGDVAQLRPAPVPEVAGDRRKASVLGRSTLVLGRSNPSNFTSAQ